MICTLWPLKDVQGIDARRVKIVTFPGVWSSSITTARSRSSRCRELSVIRSFQRRNARADTGVSRPAQISCDLVTNPALLSDQERQTVAPMLAKEFRRESGGGNHVGSCCSRPPRRQSHPATGDSAYFQRDSFDSVARFERRACPRRAAASRSGRGRQSAGITRGDAPTP